MVRTLMCWVLLGTALTGCSREEVAKLFNPGKEAAELQAAAEAMDEDALAKLIKLANEGSEEANMQLGFMYQTGKGLVRDREKARAYYLKAPSLATAKYNLALIELRPNTLEGNRSAIKLLRESTSETEACFTVAMNRLADIYFTGAKGIPKNPEGAALMWERAAACKDVEATYRIGLVYAKGEGRPKSHAQAQLHLKKAVESLHADAMWAMGDLFADRTSPSFNPVMAGQHYNLAAQLKPAKYGAKSQEYLGKLQPKERQTATDMATIWLRGHQQFQDPKPFGLPTNRIL